MIRWAAKSQKKAVILIHWTAKKLSFLLSGAACVFSCLPVFILVIGSVTGNEEWMSCLRGIWEGRGKTNFLLFPFFPTLQGFVEALLDHLEFYVVFWNAVKLTCQIVLGQMFFAVPAAWGFSRWHGRVSSLLFYSYTILMFLPFQVTMLSNYIVLDKMGLLDTHRAVVWPAVFSTFPVFLIYRSFIGIPRELYEAFSLDSGSRIRMFWHIGVPLALPGIKSAFLLSVVESWNMIEQPMLFLKTPSLWPFTLYIPNISRENVSYLFACSLIVLLPMVLIFLWGRDELRDGIGAMTLKEQKD